MTIPLDYEILRLIWWLLLGVLLIGFAIMDGFDLGVAMLKVGMVKSEAGEHSLALLAVPAIAEQHAAHIPQNSADAVHATPD